MTTNTIHRANNGPGEPGGVSPGIPDTQMKNPGADATGLACAKSLRERRLAVFILPLITVLFATSFAHAASNSVTIESSTMQPSVIIGRPMLTWWDVKIQGSGLLVGQFRFTIRHENQLLAASETEEMTLNGPDQRIRVMLPAIDNTHIDQLQVEISFHGKNFSGNLGQHVLRVPFATKKVFLALVGESRLSQKRSPQRDKLLNRLRFENLISKRKVSRSADDDREPIKTIFASIDTPDLPAEPLAYCGYDMVVLMGDQFRSLRKPQLDALLAWVKAGGSLYVEPNGVLESFHVDFLRNLVANDRQQIVFHLDPAGILPRDTVPLDQPAASVECGIGHAVIRTDDPDQEITASKEYWIAIAGPLWNFRVLPVETPLIKRVGVDRNGRPIEVLNEFANWDAFGLSFATQTQFRLSQGQLLDRLIPEGVRMVPLWVLALILSVFVGLIGPGDYFVLGWLRVRKLTWLTFPVATVGVTAFTVWLSNSYMSSTEAPRAAVMLDLDQRGEIVRTNRFELLFIAATRRVTTNVEKGLFSPLSVAAVRGQAVSNQWAMAGGQGINNINIQRIPGSGGVPIQSLPDIQGRIPTQFTVTQDLSKWTPQLNRLLWIPGTAASPKADWSQFELTTIDSDIIRRHEIPKELVVAAKKQFGQSAMVACFSGNEGWAYDRLTGWQSERSRQREIDAANQQTVVTPGMTAPQAAGEAAFFRWIYQASVAVPNPGLFSVAKQMAPKGDATCEDLPLLDSTDPKAWLLVVVVPQKDEYFIYRKLMRFKD